MRFVIQVGILTCCMSCVPSCGRADTGVGISDAAPSDQDEARSDEDDAPPSDENEDGVTAPSSSLPDDTPQLLMADGAHLAFVRASLGRGEPQLTEVPAARAANRRRDATDGSDPSLIADLTTPWSGIVTPLVFLPPDPVPSADSLNR